MIAARLFRREKFVGKLLWIRVSALVSTQHRPALTARAPDCVSMSGVPSPVPPVTESAAQLWGQHRSLQQSSCGSWNIRRTGKFGHKGRAVCGARKATPDRPFVLSSLSALDPRCFARYLPRLRMKLSMCRRSSMARWPWTVVLTGHNCSCTSANDNCGHLLFVSWTVPRTPATS